MKATVVVDQELPIGLIANCSAVLGVSLGAAVPDLIGPHITDYSGVEHHGITGLPIPILATSQDSLCALVSQSQAESAVTTIAFNDVAQKCTSYADYQQKLAQTSFESLKFLGVLIIGSKRAVARLTGSLPLLK